MQSEEVKPYGLLYLTDIMRWNHEVDMYLSKGIAVMGSEPIHGWEPEEIEEWYSQNHTETGLAQAFAAASNKFWWVEDNEYDYEEATPQYREACRITDVWRDLMDKLQEEIFVILRGEGISIPERGQIKVLVPFMERNGYYDGNGWWVPIHQ